MEPSTQSVAATEKQPSKGSKSKRKSKSNSKKKFKRRFRKRNRDGTISQSMTAGEDVDPSLVVSSGRGASTSTTVVEETDQSLVGASRWPSSSTQTEVTTKPSIRRRKGLPAKEKRMSIAESADVAVDQCTPDISAITPLPLAFVPVTFDSTATDALPEAPVLSLPETPVFAQQSIVKEDLTAPTTLPTSQPTTVEVRTLVPITSEGEAQGSLPKPESMKTAAPYLAHDAVTTLSVVAPSRKGSHRTLFGLLDVCLFPYAFGKSKLIIDVCRRSGTVVMVLGCFFGSPCFNTGSSGRIWSESKCYGPMYCAILVYVKEHRIVSGALHYDVRNNYNALLTAHTL